MLSSAESSKRILRSSWTEQCAYISAPVCLRLCPCLPHGRSHATADSSLWRPCATIPSRRSACSVNATFHGSRFLLWRNWPSFANKRTSISWLRKVIIWGEQCIWKPACTGCAGHSLRPVPPTIRARFDPFVTGEIYFGDNQSMEHVFIRLQDGCVLMSALSHVASPLLRNRCVRGCQPVFCVQDKMFKQVKSMCPQRCPGSLADFSYSYSRWTQVMVWHMGFCN